MMLAPEDTITPELSIDNLLAASTSDVINASLRELRKVLHDGPEPFSQSAEGSRNEVLAEVLDLKYTLPFPQQPQNEDRQNFEKLFSMPTEDLIRDADAARPGLVRLMQRAIRHDDSLEPKTFDPTNAAGVLSVALKWKLDATNKALQDSLHSVPISNPSNAQLPSAATEDTPEGDALVTSRPVGGGGPEGTNENPFAENNNDVGQINSDLMTLLKLSLPEKRCENLLTLRDVRGGKRVRFSTLGQMSAEHHEGLNGGSSQDFRKSGSNPTDRLPPHLMGEYVGRRITQLVLRVFVFRSGEILAGLLQEGTTIEMAVRNRHWKRTLAGEAFHSEQEAVTLSRIVHLTLMCFATVEDALSMAPWLETSLRRLFAILYVEEHSKSADRATLWRIAGKMLETQAESTLQVPSMTKLMAQSAALYSKERNALTSLSSRSNLHTKQDNRKRKRDAWENNKNTEGRD